MMTLRFSTRVAAIAVATASAPGLARAPGTVPVTAPATSAATTTQMDHISVQMLGTSGTPVILAAVLSSP